MPNTVSTSIASSERTRLCAPVTSRGAFASACWASRAGLGADTAFTLALMIAGGGATFLAAAWAAGALDPAALRQLWNRSPG